MSEVKKETVAEFFARGGKVTNVKSVEIPRWIKWNPKTPVFQNKYNAAPK